MTPASPAATALSRAHVRQQVLRRFAKACVDFLCGCAAVITPAILLGEAHTPISTGQALLLATVVGIGVATVNAVGGAYRTVWHYSGIKEGLSLAISAVAVLVLLSVLRLVGVAPLARADIVFTALLVYVFCSVARLLRRMQVASMKRRVRSMRAAASTLRERHVLIVGAGDAGVQVCQELQPDNKLVTIVGFLDDDLAKQGTNINGVPVLGEVARLFDVAAERDVTEVIIAMPSADEDRVRTLVRRCEDVGLRVHALPGIERLVMSGTVHRPGVIGVHDLLGDFAATTTHSRDRHVLVTGGGGFIGSHLTRMLLDRGYRVRVLDSFAYGAQGLSPLRNHPHLEVMQGDICSIRDVSRAMRDVEGVVALAAIVGDPACNVDFEETINLNYASTKILTEAADFYGVKRLVFASSCSVYGASANEDDMLTERSRLNPVSLYARTRVLSENIVFDRCGDVEPVVLRLATVFGLSTRMRFDLVVNTLTARAVVDGKISIFGGNQWRPNVHCQDAARAFAAALEAPADVAAGEIFNVGGDSQNFRIADLGRMVAEIVGDVEVATQDEVPDPRDYRVSFEKIRRALDFTPAYTVADGIREVAAAVRADAALRDHGQPRFHNVHALKNFLEQAESERLVGV